VNRAGDGAEPLAQVMKGVSMTRPIELISELDRALIGDLFARYSHGFDHDDVEQLLSTFTDDGVFDSELNGRIEGRRELRTFFESVSREAAHERRRSGQHWVNGTLFTSVTDGEVRASSSFVFLNERSGAPAASIMGEYEDVIVRTPDGWRFANRYIRILIDADSA
jgi:hypothetical protein